MARLLYKCQYNLKFKDMKNTYTAMFTLGFMVIANMTFSQTLGSRTSISASENTQPTVKTPIENKSAINSKEITNELKAWDPVRGEWLANSMVAISTQSPVPDRTFPENVTPQELFAVVPSDVRARVLNSTNNGVQSAQNNNERDQWMQMQQFANRPNCSLSTGKTYGDPHLKSFDGATYSFQTVGEFVLAKSASGDMEVQVRQQPQKEDFSLNTAVAMNVTGDRVSIYTTSYDTRNFRSNVHVNGQEVMLTSGDYFLPRGGVLRRVGKGYDVVWPSGERVIISERNSGGMEFFNIEVQVFACNTQYQGILGNANGNRNDDFDVRGGNNNNLAWQNWGSGPSNARTDAMEKEYLAYLAKDFARSWRITPETSLFDYSAGLTTYSYIDESYPRVHHTLNDLNQTDRDNARKVCEGRGISGNDLDGCVYDQAYLRIEPDKGRDYNSPISNGRLDKVTNPRPNVNTVPVITPQPVPVTRPGGDGGTRPAVDGKVLEKEQDRNIDGKPQGDTKIQNTNSKNDNKTSPVLSKESPNTGGGKVEPEQKPVINKPAPVNNESETKPVVEPKPVVTPKPEPKPVITPKPRVEPEPKVVTPKPVVKPAPVVTPATTVPTTGRGK